MNRGVASDNMNGCQELLHSSIGAAILLCVSLVWLLQHEVCYAALGALAYLNNQRCWLRLSPWSWQALGMHDWLWLACCLLAAQAADHGKFQRL